MLSKIKQNGDDLRFSDDEAGNSELPKELVKFDKTTGDIVWSNFPSVVEGLVYHVWANNAAAIQPAPSAAFGRNAVWVNYAMVAHTESANLIDSTGNDTISAEGAITTGVTGAVGDGIAFSAATIGITKDTNAGVNFTSGYTFSVSATITGDTNYAGFLRNSGMQIIKDKDLPNLRVEHNDGTTSTRVVIPNGYSNLVVFNALHRYTLTWDGSTFSSYRDGVPIDTISQTRGVSVTGETNFTYEVGNPPGFVTSLYDESFVRNGHSDADRVSIEDQNLSATTGWWIAADVGIQVGDSVDDANGDPWLYVGKFFIGDGPRWNDGNSCYIDGTSPPEYESGCVIENADNVNGVQAAEIVFGVITGEEYGTSTSETVVNRQSWYNEFQGVSGTSRADSIATSGLYDTAGDLSAYILDGYTAGADTYVFKRDNTRPVITLVPNTGEFVINKGDPLPSLPVGTATDNIDGDVTITPVGYGPLVFDSNTPGEYDFIYSHTDVAGNAAYSKFVTVTVEIVIGDIVNDENGDPWTYVGQFSISDGPSWSTNPLNINGIQAAEQLFGALVGKKYGCSTRTHIVYRNAYYDAVPGSSPLADDTVVSGNYQDGGVSAYVNDRLTASAITYVFTQDLPAVSLLLTLTNIPDATYNAIFLDMTDATPVLLDNQDIAFINSTATATLYVAAGRNIVTVVLGTDPTITTGGADYGTTT
jgi:hypothetical protein